MAPSKPMTKSELSAHIARKAGITNKAANEILNELAAVAYKEVKKNKQFTIPGIGKLVLGRRKARMGRNPATGKQIKIAAKKVVKFRVAKACKYYVVGYVTFLL